jgi:diguanylate cyclase
MTSHEHHHEPLIRSRILKQNLKRLTYLPLVAIPVNIGHIIWFRMAFDGSDPIENSWRLGIIWSHGAILAISVFLGSVSFLSLKNIWQNELLAQRLTEAGVILLILAGVAITVIDQLVTTAITPFIILCIVIAFLIHLQPWKALVMYLLAFVLLFFLLPLTQFDQIVLASGRVNALTVIGVGFFLSLVMWRNTWSAQQNEIIIDEQNLALETSNKDLTQQAEKLK